MNYEKLIADIKKAKTVEEIKSLKQESGYLELIGRVNNVTNVQVKKIRSQEAIERKKNHLIALKKKLKGYIGEEVFYVGFPDGEFGKNETVTLIGLRRTRATIELNGQQWTLPIKELDTVPTSRLYMKENDGRLKLV